MEILITSTVSEVTIFLILSSPHGYICLTTLKITSTLGRLYTPSVTSSMNSLSSSSTLEMGRTLFFRHRSWTLTDPYSFEQATWQTWGHTSPVKTGPTNVWDDAILPPTVSDDDTGTLFCTPLPSSPHFSVACPEKTHEFPENPDFFCPFLWGGTLSQTTQKSRWSRVGTSKIILDLVRWIMVRIGKVGREVVKSLDYQW
jgi:hypothetical protein